MGHIRVLRCKGFVRVTRDLSDFTIRDLHNYAIENNVLIEINKGRVEEVILEVIDNGWKQE